MSDDLPHELTIIEESPIAFSTDFPTVAGVLDTIAPPPHSRYVVRNLERGMQRVAQACSWSPTGAARFFVEPNDGTRYALFAQRLGDTLVVARMEHDGTHAKATGVVLLTLAPSHISADDCRALSNGNAWSAVVMAYTCACLLRGLRRLSFAPSRAWSEELRDAS